MARLRRLCVGNPSAETFVDSIGNRGPVTYNQVRNGCLRDTDAQIRHKAARYAGVVFEVAPSAQSGGLEDPAKCYSLEQVGYSSSRGIERQKLGFKEGNSEDLGTGNSCKPRAPNGRRRIFAGVAIGVPGREFRPWIIGAWVST
ncbi:hypothetical protein AYL99_04040 [Fonsecaea erecta]|uniref:Uncharacterized protein n=1 Tax=Fonsecaea erecta TaxID=1367422 RepID=A0A178ZPW7_9EURO|nr:hypothetical protein AYL99_04040 [Fonsecaea erecta]OAP61837.1 hypothetical protein AYL99_04040 [Fonsecaea erecta]